MRIPRACSLLPACIVALSMLTGCGEDPVSSSEEVPDETGSTGAVHTADYTLTVAQALAANRGSHESAADYTWDASSVVRIAFAGSSITVAGTGATVDGNRVVITAPGTYSLSGTLTDGQVTVHTDDEETVRLILNGVNLTSTTSAPISIEKAEKTVVFLAAGTENVLTDAVTYVYPDPDEDEPNAALFSKGNLSLAGTGTLTVRGRYNDGIGAKDGLIIAGGTINVTAADDGIRGKDYLIVKDGTVRVSAGGDGLKADNDEDADRGYVLVEGGSIDVTTGGDGVTAETDALIAGGTVTLTSGGGSNRTVSDDLSAKGIKAGVTLIVDGGTVTASSADDALHSNGKLALNGGTLDLATSDDGIHADSAMGINGGNITVRKSYEGIESNVGIAINDGTLHITSSDDGINAASGTGTEARPGAAIGNYYLYINDGTIVVDAAGDGIDINGSMVMSGGEVIVNGPVANMNGALDYDRSFALNGGFLVAAGSAGMAQTAGTSSAQPAVLLNLSAALPAGTLFHIETSDGDEVLSFTPTKRYQSIAFSSSALKKGTTYTVYYGGSVSGGAMSEGLYRSGTYTPGTKYGTFTVSSTVTRVTL